MEALLGGTLVVEEGCFRLRSGAGETRLIVWAPHVTLHADRRSVRSASSGQAARAGDTINFSGGEASAETIGQHRLSRPLPPECRGPYVIMGEGFTVA
jgi:hypothetical protein